MLSRFFGLILGIFGLALSSPAHAGFILNDDYVIIPVSFSGTVTNSITEDIKIRNAAGAFVPYTGPVPDYPYNPGDPISLSFDAIVPSPAAIERGLVASSSNGIYSFEIGPRPVQLPDFPEFGSYQNLDISGVIIPSADLPLSSFGGLGVVYNANTGEYFIDPDVRLFGSEDSFGFGFFDAPTLVYDPSNNSLTSMMLSTIGRSGVAFSGNATSGRIPIGIRTPDGFGTTVQSGFLGRGEIRFDTGFNLPFFDRKPTPVPAPSALLLFGVGAGALAWRRRKSSPRSGTSL